MPLGYQVILLGYRVRLLGYPTRLWSYPTELSRLALVILSPSFRPQLGGMFPLAST